MFRRTTSWSKLEQLREKTGLEVTWLT